MRRNFGFRFVEADNTNAQTHGYKGSYSSARDFQSVEEEVDGGNGRSEQYSGDLIKGDRRISEGKIHKEYVEAHGDSEWQHCFQANALRSEERDERP